jgi:uncharacterized protein YeaO (DUF488 family)
MSKETPMAKKPRIQLKRAYDAPANADGYRVLVDRIWPRGISKDELRLNDWLKDVAPSTELRKWIHSDPEKWQEFRKRYFKELEEQQGAVEALEEKCREKTVTLIYAAKDPERNNAAALKDFLEQRLSG